MADAGLLFDTQAVISWAMASAPPAVVDVVRSGAPVYVSIVSLWEFLLKASYKSIGINFEELQLTVKALSAKLLSIDIRHLETLEKLPFITDHKDPFDRLIVSQAISEGLFLVGADRVFPKYSDTPVGRGLQILWQ